MRLPRLEDEYKVKEGSELVLPCVRGVRVPEELGRVLQLPDTKKPMDHWPLITEFQYAMDSHVGLRRVDMKWNRDALAAGVLEGFNRRELIEKVEGEKTATG